MTPRLAAVKRKRVVSLTEGKDLGSVHEVYLDSEVARISGLVIDRAGLLGGRSWIAIESLRRVGEDVIFVDSVKNCRNKQPIGRAMSNLRGVPVVTEGDTIVGNLEDIEIDGHWGIEELRLSGCRTVVPEPGWVAFEDAAIVLDRRAVDTLRDTLDDKPGFLERMLGVSPWKITPAEREERSLAEQLSTVARVIEPLDPES